jgi:hypothetical protein
MIYNILIIDSTYAATVPVENNLAADPVLTLVVNKTQTSTEKFIEKTLTSALNGETGLYEISITLDETETAELSKGIYYYSVSSPTESILTGGVIVGNPTINTSDETEESIYLIQNGNTVYVMFNDFMQQNTDYRLTSTYQYQADGNPDIYYNTQQITFSSDYYPLFCTFSSVKDLVSLYHINVSDELIYKTIRDNSESIQRLTTRTDITDWDGELPHEFGEYIKNKTIYDLVLNVYVNSSVTSGHSKKLGELSIENGADSSVYELLGKLKENLNPWYDLAMGTGIAGKAAVASVSRAQQGTKGFAYPYDRGIN